MNKILRIWLKNLQCNIMYALESDERFNRNEFKRRFGHYPNLKTPKTFVEKLLYLKQHYYNPLQNVCADKFLVSQYVQMCGYEDILKDVYQVCSDPRDIDISKLPDKFFIQCSHTQGNNYVVDKSDTEKLEQIKKEYKYLLKRKHYKLLRENCYKYIEPKVICSEFLSEPGKKSLTDYKFYCFDGEPKYFMVSYGEFDHDVTNHKFDIEFNSIDNLFKKKAQIKAEDIEKPKNFERMVEIVKKLCKPFPHVRVDLYNLDGRIVFGEMTFYSAGGFVNGRGRVQEEVGDEEMNTRIGSWINLEKHKDFLV